MKPSTLTIPGDGAASGFCSDGDSARTATEDVNGTGQCCAAAAMANQLAHQINNPLQSITSALYLALHQPGADRQYLELASQQLEHLSSLVKKILDLHFTTKA